MCRNTLIILLKAPRLGRVKTRLAAGIGAVAAQTVYRRLMRRTLHRLTRDRRWRTVLAVSPAASRCPDWPPDCPRQAQPQGDLGMRMSHGLHRLARPRAVLVGADIPEISAAAVARAFQRLRNADLIFGPSPDGGYWLVGWQRRRAWPRGALVGVAWSSRRALADSLASLPGRRIAWADRLADLDTAADLPRPQI
jgi:rSAM/selenodomain-associated transferase 1